MRRVEFWPDYGGVLLHDGGIPLAIESLPLPSGLVDSITGWIGQYDDGKLDPATRDEAWIAEGQRYFRQLRRLLRAQAIELHDWEGYWDVSPGTVE
jgi:hypothetical protein